MEVGTYHFTRGPKYDVDAYMATLFGGGAWDLYWESGRAKKTRPNSQHKSREYFRMKGSRSDFNEN